MKRIIQFITNVHRIHHIHYCYGYTFRPIPWGYFKGFGIKKISKEQFHDCTLTGIY